MNKKSKVIAVRGNGTWEGQYGLMYKFEIEMENGDIGEYMTKSEDQTKFVEGQTTDYVFIDGAYPKIKPVNTFQGGGGGGYKKNDNVQEYIIKQSSLKCAVELCIARGVYTRDDIISEAEFLTDWVLGVNQDNPFS